MFGLGVFCVGFAVDLFCGEDTIVFVAVTAKSGHRYHSKCLPVLQIAKLTDADVVGNLVNPSLPEGLRTLLMNTLRVSPKDRWTARQAAHFILGTLSKWLWVMCSAYWSMYLCFPLVLKIHQCFLVKVTFLLWSLLVLRFHLHHQRQPLALHLQLSLQNHLFTHHRLLPKIIQLLQLVMAVFRTCHPNFNDIHFSFVVLKFSLRSSPLGRE